MASAYRIVRYFMIIFNLIFLLCGIGALTAGIILRVDREDRLLYLEVCDKFDYHSVAYITIGSGLFIIVVSAIGLLGALKESRSILLSFCCCLFTLFLVEVTTGILTVVYKTEVEDELKDCMNGTLLKYYRDKQLQKSWDKIQKELSCCGVVRSKDYQYTYGRKFNESAPSSCGSNLEKGCHRELKDRATDAIAEISVIVGFVAFVELVGIALALWIICKISEKYHV